MSSAIQYLTNEEGEKTAVIVPWEDFREMLRALGLAARVDLVAP